LFGYGWPWDCEALQQIVKIANVLYEQAKNETKAEHRSDAIPF